MLRFSFRRVFVLGLIAAFAGCKGPDEAAPASGCVGEECTTAPPCLKDATGVCGDPAGWLTCPAGFAAQGDEPGCAPVLATSCPPKTMAALGGACTPVGARCGDGFVDDETGCKPTIASSACAGATRVAIGSPTCIDVGACTSGPPADADTFVDPSFATAELDASHVRTIAEALARPSSKIIAVAAGTYAERLVVGHSGVRLVGRCAAKVFVDGTSLPVAGDGIVVDGVTNVSIEGVTVRHHARGLHVKHGGKASLVHAIVEESSLAGVQVETPGSRLDVSASVIRDGLPGSIRAGAGGVGAVTGARAILTLTDVSIERAVGIGVDVEGNGGSVELTRVAVVDTREDSDKAFGMGLFARGGSLKATSSAVLGAHEMGLGCTGESKCTFDDGVIRDVLPSTASGRGFGYGMQALEGTLKVSNSTVSHAVHAGLFAQMKGSISATSTTLYDTGGYSAPDDLGPAVLSAAGGAVNLESVAIVKSRAGGIAAEGSTSVVEGTDVLIDDVGNDNHDVAGHGVEVTNGGHVTLRGARISRATETGMFVEGARSRATFERVVISDTQPNFEGGFGFGVTVATKGTLVMQDSAVVGSRAMGVVVTGAQANAHLSGIFVDGTHPQDKDGKFGRNLQIQEGGTASVDGATLTNGTEAAAAVVDPTSTLVMTHALLSRTRPSRLNAAGRSLIAQGGGSATLSSSVVFASTQSGATAVGSGTSLTVDHCVFSNTATDATESLGHAVVGANHAIVRVNSTRLSSSAGAALAFQSATGKITNSRIEGNRIGILVADGTPLEEMAGDDFELAEGTVRVSTDTSFAGNDARTGGGAVPLPDVSKSVGGAPAGQPKK